MRGLILSPGIPEDRSQNEGSSPCGGRGWILVDRGIVLDLCMLDPNDPCQPILPFDHTKEGEKQRVTHKKTDDRISFVESLAFNRRSFGYKPKISLIGSQSLGLEYVFPQNFVRLVIVRFCQFLNPGPVRFVFIREKILQDLGKLISK